MACLFRDHRPVPGAGGKRRGAGDHHAARPVRGLPEHLDLDPEVRFPGRLIPSVPAFRETVDRTSLRVVNDLSFGPAYAETLRLWRERFEGATTQLDTLGFDAEFRRMWTFYLAYCEAGFRSRYLDVHQFILRRPELVRRVALG